MSQRLHDLLAPVIADLGYELWHLEYNGAGPNSLLRLYIDAPEGVGLEDCEKVSHEVSAALDVAEDSSHNYQLEVSSPGLDRPLVTAAHFQRFIGDSARITMFAPVADQRKFRGVIKSADAATVELDCDGQIFQLSIKDMARARLEPVFEA